MSSILINILEGIKKLATGLGMLFLVLVTFIKEISVMFYELTVKIASLPLNTTGFGDVDFSASGLDVELINSFIPLQEAWAMLITIMIYWSVILVIRWIKSFVPTVAN